MSDIGQCDSTLHSMWSCRSYVHTSLTFLQAGTNDRDTWIGQTWQADHGVHASPFPPVPKYSCVLTELTIYNDFSHRYPGIDRIVDGIAGPIEEILAVSDIDTAWPQRLNALRSTGCIWLLEIWWTSIRKFGMRGHHTYMI